MARWYSTTFHRVTWRGAAARSPSTATVATIAPTGCKSSLCATDGTPVAIEVFEGDTADPQTIRDQVDKLRRRFRLSHVAMVGDRGMITSARITEELKPAGLDWISCLRAPQIAALAEDQGPLQMCLFDERDLAAIT